MSDRPEVVTNRKGGTVAAAISGWWRSLLSSLKEPPSFEISTAYFNPGGFSLLASELEDAAHVRLMLGAEPDVAEELGRLRHLGGDHLPGDDRDVRLRHALREHHRLMEEDRNLITFSRREDARIRRMISWLRSGRVEARLLRKRFLHGKAFIANRDGVLAGSSNFTYAGLARNVELNLGQYQPGVVGEVMDWYEEQWSDAEDFDLASLYERRFDEHDPYIVYLRMLYERYKDELDREEPPPGLPLTAFQRDGLYRAMDYLHRNNGVLIADGVGLGKTFLAGELIRQSTHDRRQRVLLVAPAALRDGPWEQFLREYDLKNVQCVSFQELANDRRVREDGGGNRALWHDLDEYAMVVIDEAHAYRNPDTDRAATLRKLLSGAPPKQVVLLTATPVNNSLWDLFHLISYFVKNDTVFLEAGVPSLRKHFAEAESENPEDLSPDKLFDILDAVAVRRTRRFVKRFYPHERIKRGGKEITITFPQPEVLREEYDLDGLLPGFFHRFAHALGADVEAEGSPLPSPDDFEYGEQLTLARYAPSAYLRGESRAETFELQAAGLLRSGLLKRFESSAHAFARTCRTMAGSHGRFLEALEAGHVLTGESLLAWTNTDTDEFDLAEANGGRRDPASDYDAPKLRTAVEADRDLLVAFAEEAESIPAEDDPKLDALIESLATIAEEAKTGSITPSDERDKRKVIVFSYFADTVKWVYERLEVACEEDPRLAVYRGRIATVTGSSGGTEDVLFGFAPESSQAPEGFDEDKYDLLVATDVLAEGVNLQQARHIINFDLPWNPMRLVQRHGRIDRIGSPHSHVYLRCFFPSEDLDALLGLEDALQRKITQAARSIGVEGEIVPGSKASDRNFAHTKEQIKNLLEEDASLFESAEETGALSGEEFRRELTEALHNPRLAERVKTLPWVAGSGKATDGEGGYIFCARVGDHPRPQYRWVPIGRFAPGSEEIGNGEWGKARDETSASGSFPRIRRESVEWESESTRGEKVENTPTPETSEAGYGASASPLPTPGDRRERWRIGPDPIVDDTLACLGKAVCASTTGRVLPEDIADLAYDAWEAAREHIYEAWMRSTDPANMRPAIPKPMRDAAELLNGHPPKDLDGERLRALLDAIEAPYDTRTQTMMRKTLAAHESMEDKVSAVISLVEELGLQPPPAVEPLPEIEVGDVNLVAWMALVPEEKS